MRARNLKPSFFKNELLATSDPIYAWVFEGLWCLADREGRLEDRPRRIHLEINAGRAFEGTESALNWLTENGFLLRYEVAGKRYIQVLNFTKHQNPHIREPASEIPAPDKHGASTVPAPDEHQSGPALSPFLIPDSSLLTEREKTRGVRACGTGLTQIAGGEAWRDVEGIDSSAFERWLTTAETRGKSLDGAGRLALAKWLAGRGANQAAIVEQSVRGGWKNLRELETSGKRSASIADRLTWRPEGA